jgi:uncharacterized protein YjbJ (UPF0337 family)
MNSDILEGKWKQMRGSVKAFFGKLTDDDLTTVEGNSDRLVGVLQERYGYTRDQAQAEWDKFVRTTNNVSNDAQSYVSAGVEKTKAAAADAADAVKRAADNVKQAVR